MHHLLRVLLLMLIIGLTACKSSEDKIDQLAIARKYYKALDNSSSVEMKALLSDSLSTVIPEYNYVVNYSRNDYLEKWLKWDSVFEPTYKVLDMKLENGMVRATISKIDKRISFLMQEPFITQEILKFQDDKIAVLETAFENFNEETWDKNRTELLEWIDQNHPELNGFIYDQTEAGGIKYLKAMELYRNKE